MKVKLNSGMPPFLVRGEKNNNTNKKTKKRLKNAHLSKQFFQREGEHKLWRLNDFVLKWKRENSGRRRTKRRALLLNPLVPLHSLSLKLFLKLVRNMDGAEEKTENYKHQLAVQHAQQTSLLLAVKSGGTTLS